MTRTATVAVMIATLAIAGQAAAAASPLPAKVTRPFAARAAYFVKPSSSYSLECSPVGASFRCVMYRPGSPGGLNRQIAVGGKRTWVTVRGATLLSRSSGCTYKVTHIGATLDVAGGHVEMVDTCAAGWATRLSMP